MEIFLVIIAVMILISIFMALEGPANDNMRKIDGKLEKLDGNKPAADFRFIHLGASGQRENTTIAISNDRKKLFVTGLGEFTDLTLDISKITEVELRADETSITKTARGSQLLGAAVGGVLLGGVGAVIGGLSGKKISVSDIKSLELHIKLNDFKNSSHSILVWKKNFGLTKSPSPVEQCQRTAQELIEKLDILINDGVQKRTQLEIGANDTSTVDELGKLHQLFEKGVLNEQEFKALKAKLLG